MTAGPLDWRKAELLAAWHMQQLLMFSDATVTSPGNDGGVDVGATNAVGQVKHYRDARVGAPEVQQIKGAAYDGQWAIFYSLGGYTTAAKLFADDAAVALFTYDEAGVVDPVNNTARILMSTAGAPNQVAEFQQYLDATNQLQQYIDSTLNKGRAISKFIAEVVRRVRTMKFPDPIKMKRVVEVANKAASEMKEAERLVSEFSRDLEGTPEEVVARITPVEEAQRRAADILRIDYDAEVVTPEIDPELSGRIIWEGSPRYPVSHPAMQLRVRNTRPEGA